MPTSVGPKTVAEDSLVFAFDQDYFPHGWGLEQLAYNPTFEESGTKPSGPGVYSSGNYLGAMTQSIMQGGTFSYTGGDLSNYYSTNPEWRGWDNGGIGSTGGNWVYFNDILPLATSSLEDYIVDVRLRFVYVSLTGNGSTNPYVQIGRAYNTFKSIYYNEVGTDFKRIRFKFNGAQGNNYGGNNRDLTFGCTSADAMVEMDHFYVYRINKSTGLKDLTGNSTIDLTNVSFDSNAQVDYDGSNDYINLGSSLNSIGSTATFEMVFKAEETNDNYRVMLGWGNGNSNYSGIHIGSWTSGLADESLHVNFNSATLTYHIRKGHTYYKDNQYHHLVVTAGPGNYGVWIDGVQEDIYFQYGSQSSVFANLIGYNANIVAEIGRRPYGGGTGYFNGKLPLMKIYDRILTASEIKANYNAVKGRFNI